MRGITAWATYLPFRRLDRGDIAAIAGKGGGRGTRTVASFDEDPTTMAVEAGRRAMRSLDIHPDLLLFGSVNPAYADKTNATAIHAALRLDTSCGAFDLGLSPRSALAGVLLAAKGAGSALVVSGDIRTGLAGSVAESAGGDAGAAIMIGDDSSEAPVLAEIIGTSSRTAEFVDRWRTPGEPHSKVWDEAFAQTRYAPLGSEAFHAALVDAGVEADQVAAVAISAPTPRISAAAAKNLGLSNIVDDFSQTVGQCGAAQPGLMLAHLLESASPRDIVVLVSLSDGADVVVMRATEAIADDRHAPTVADQAAGGAPVSYGKFLSWRGTLQVDPPRRPEPQRVSATAAARSTDWKFGFVASVDPETGSVHLPPLRVSADGERTDAMGQRPMADVSATIATFTIDRVAFSPSPPIVFAVVDFDGGGRLPLEVCDCDENEVEIGQRVEMTFRLLHTVDGIPNYFWKARLQRG